MIWISFIMNTTNLTVNLIVLSYPTCKNILVVDIVQLSHERARPICSVIWMKLTAHFLEVGSSTWFSTLHPHYNGEHIHTQSYREAGHKWGCCIREKRENSRKKIIIYVTHVMSKTKRHFSFWFLHIFLHWNEIITTSSSFRSLRKPADGLNEVVVCWFERQHTKKNT